MKNMLIRMNQKRQDTFNQYKDLVNQNIESKAFDQALEDALKWQGKGKRALEYVRKDKERLELIRDIE